MLSTKKRIGVVLCGCGHRDGSEVHEATLTLLAIDQAGALAVCFAPKGNMRYVRDHQSGRDLDGCRDMLVESARISRGNVHDLSEAKASELDALVIPGGQGAALNLSTFLLDGPGCRVQPDLSRLIGEMLRAGKPVGAICIAPATLARVLQQEGISATITCGTDDEVAAALESMGQKHERCATTNCVIDREHKIVTTPAYMNARSIGEVWQGVERLVRAIVDLT